MTGFAKPSASCISDCDLTYSDLGGAILDSRAKVAYRQRLEDLREEWEEAQACNDAGRIASARQEMELLTETLAAAIGLRGQDRRVSHHAERARVSVTKAIKSSVKKIILHHPVLGHYLGATLKTGGFCVYTPDVRLPIVWTF